MKERIWAPILRWGYRGSLIAVLLVSAAAVGSLLLNFFGGMFASNGGQTMGFLQWPGINLQSTYDAIVSFLIVAVPVVLSWYARNYLKSADSQKRLGVISTLAGAAINYAEDCDRRGEREVAYSELDVPENMARNPTPGNQKLCLAADWLTDELKRIGIKRVSLDDAAKWVAAEYQKQVGDLRGLQSITQLTDSAADLLNQLGRAGQITLPSDTLEAVSLLQSITDWAAKQSTATNADRTLQRELAMTRISPRSLMATNGNGRAVGKLTVEMRLSMLAQRAVEFVADLQRQGKLRLPERDTARAWLVQQIQQEDVAVTPEQIDKALAVAFEQKYA